MVRDPHPLCWPARARVNSRRFCRKIILPGHSTRAAGRWYRTRSRPALTYTRGRGQVAFRRLAGAFSSTEQRIRPTPGVARSSRACQGDSCVADRQSTSGGSLSCRVVRPFTRPSSRCQGHRRVALPIPLAHRYHVRRLNRAACRPLRPWPIRSSKPAGRGNPPAWKVRFLRRVVGVRSRLCSGFVVLTGLRVDCGGWVALADRAVCGGKRQSRGLSRSSGRCLVRERGVARRCDGRYRLVALRKDARPRVGPLIGVHPIVSNARPVTLASGPSVSVLRNRRVDAPTANPRKITTITSDRCQVGLIRRGSSGLVPDRRLDARWC